MKVVLNGRSGNWYNAYIEPYDEKEVIGIKFEIVVPKSCANGNFSRFSEIISIANAEDLCMALIEVLEKVGWKPIVKFEVSV